MLTNDYVAQVAKEADDYVSVYLHGRAIGQPTTLEQKALIENIVATDYDGRAVIELLQNAHDAHVKGTRDGRVLFRFDARRGEHGVLVVANGGRPFGLSNLQAICRVALSSKAADEGIGNKGVGFKSVLQLTASPEIYSTAGVGATRFDGFCFRFARPVDFDDVANRHRPTEPRFADELRANVSALKLPVPITEIPADIADLPSRGFVTAVLLELSSAAAARAAVAMLDEIESDIVPVHLFLDRVSSIEIDRLAVDGSGATRTLTRSSTDRPTNGGAFDAQDVTLNGTERFVVLTRNVAEAVVRTAIAESREQGRVGAAFESWTGSAEVAIAMRADGVEIPGRLYTFLPMAESAPVPLPAHVNAPFFAHLNRKELSTTVPFNSLLLDELAELAASAALATSNGQCDLDPNCLIDLVSWTTAELPRLRASFERRAVELQSAKVFPSAPAPARRFSSLDSIWVWEPTGVAVITPEAVAARLGEDFLDVGVSAGRRRSMERLASALGWRLQPDSDDVAAWAAGLARAALSHATTTEPFDAGFWASYYDDLSVLIPRPKSEFEDHPFILDDSGQLLPSAGTGHQPVLFFHPQSGEPGALNVELPSQLQDRVRFTDRRIPRLLGQSKRPGRAWLEANFVREYLSEALLELIGVAMREPVSDADRSELLGFAFDLWRNARDKPNQALRNARLLLPTQGGWTAAVATRFSGGWGSGDDLETSRLYESFAQEASAEVASLAALRKNLLESPESALWPPSLASDQGYEFLTAAGVKVGLHPEGRASDVIEIRGWILNSPASLTGVGFSQLTSAEVAMWSRAAVSLKSGAVQYKEPYRADQPVWRLPGQTAYDRFSPALREKFAELVLRGLPSWSDSVLFVTFRRSSDYGSVRWPSLVLSFLHLAAWVPQRVPGAPGQISFAVPTTAWWTGSGEVPNLVPVQPRRLNSLNNSRTLDRLLTIGVRLWDSPATGVARLATICDILRTRRARGRDLLELRNAYESAWSDALQGKGEIPPQSATLVRRRSELELIDIPNEETIYAPDRAGVSAAQLLTQVPVPVLAIRDSATADAVYQVLSKLAGAKVRLASHAQVEIRADGLSPEDLPALQVSKEWPWFADLVLSVVQTEASSTHTAGSERLKSIQRRLSELMVASAESVVTYIEGLEVQGAARSNRSFFVDTGRGPLVIVDRPRGDTVFSLMEDAASGVMEAMGFRELSDTLAMALVRLGRQAGLESPDLAELASALNLDLREVEWASAQHQPYAGPAQDALVLIVGLLDPELIDSFLEASTSFASDESVLAWLRENAGTFGVPAEQIMALALDDDIRSTATVLGVDLRRVNLVLRIVAKPPLHNTEGHVRRFEAFRAAHLAEFVDRVRGAFANEAHHPAALARYIELRCELEQLDPDPVWLDDHWDLPDSVCTERFAAWFQAHGIDDAMPLDLAPLPEVIEGNRRVVAGVMSGAPAIVDAWTLKSGEVAPILPDVGTVQRALQESGRLDFVRIASDVVIEYLATSGAWPASMPRTLNLGDLGLNRAEVDRARDRNRLERAEVNRKLDAISYNGRSFVGDDLDRDELAAWVLSQLPAQLLATSTNEALLPVFEKSLSSTREKGSGRWMSDHRTSERKRNSVGYIGELVAARWIEEQYGVPPTVSWCSRNREHYLGTPGDDGLGYDFRVATDSQIHLFEVKATTGVECQFEMGETEVRRAQALEVGERYTILFVTNVTDPALTRIRPLPNPFGRNGLARYGLLGHKLRLGFQADGT